MQLDIWDEFRSLERRMDDLLRSFLGPRARASFPSIPSGLRRPFVPAADVFGADGTLVVRIEIPGIDPARDLTVTAEEGQLVVRGERREEREVEEEAYLRREACYGAFERRLALPEGVDEDAIRAEYENGILEIVIPAPAEIAGPRAKAIPIKTVKAKAA